jgi:hypothetical protein
MPAPITYTVRSDCRHDDVSLKPGDTVELDPADAVAIAWLAKGIITAPPAPAPSPKRSKSKPPEPEPGPTSAGD